MATRKIITQQHFQATPKALFELLITPSAIREWWSAARAIVIPKKGGIWTAAWGDHEDRPDYISTAVIKSFSPHQRLVLSDYQYHSENGNLPFDADFITTFDIESLGDESLLKVTQDGFPTIPASDDFYNACHQGWLDTFEGITDFLKGDR